MVTGGICIHSVFSSMAKWTAIEKDTESEHPLKDKRETTVYFRGDQKTDAQAPQTWMKNGASPLMFRITNLKKFCFF